MRWRTSATAARHASASSARACWAWARCSADAVAPSASLERGVGLVGEALELGLGVGERGVRRAELGGHALVLLLRRVELGLGLGRRGLGVCLCVSELLLEVGDLLRELRVLLLELLDLSRARRVDVVLVALEHRGPDRQPYDSSPERDREHDPRGWSVPPGRRRRSRHVSSPAAASRAAKNSSALRVFVSCAPDMSMPRSVR